MSATLKQLKWSTWAVLALCFWGGIARAQEPRPNCYVLAVGVDQYQNARKLSGCVNDAKNAAQTFRQQKGSLFDDVSCTILLDSQASRQRIEKEMKTLAAAGKEGDAIVLFLSGHGSRQNKKWAFLPNDFDPKESANTTISDEAILQFADALAAEGKNVCIIVDACFAGQLRLSAKSLLTRYRDPEQGSIILMVSSMPNQTSAACGSYSAFAYAVKEGMDGKADFNNDGLVTLQELRRYVYHRVYELQGNDQDGEIDYSLSASDSMIVAMVKPGQVAAELPVQGNDARRENAPVEKVQDNAGKSIRGQLTANDAFDKLKPGCHAKVYTVQLTAGKHVIDLMSGTGRPGVDSPNFFDTYLRVEDAHGNVVAENDDNGESLNSRVTLQVSTPGEHRIVVTSFAQGAVGDFEVRIR